MIFKPQKRLFFSLIRLSGVPHEFGANRNVSLRSERVNAADDILRHVFSVHIEVRKAPAIVGHNVQVNDVARDRPVVPPLFGDGAALRFLDRKVVGDKSVAVEYVPRIRLAPAVERALSVSEVIPCAQIRNGAAVFVERGRDHRRIEVHRGGAFAPAEQSIGHKVFDIVLVAFAFGDVSHPPNGVYGGDVLCRIHDPQIARNELGYLEHVCGGIFYFVHVVACRCRIAEGKIAAETGLVARGDGSAVHGGAAVDDVRRNDDSRFRKIRRHLQRARLRLPALL